MSNVIKDASERAFQENFVKELMKYRWEAPAELNGNSRKVTVDHLIQHWRSELNRINADQLEGVPLTDAEFEQVMMKVKQLNNSYEAAKLLAIEDSKGKIDGIYRSKNPRVKRDQITLTIFKKAEVSGGDSSYRIAREVEGKYGNRFDLVLLINGLPLINIEQKRSDQTLDFAYQQFKRYYAAGEFSNEFMTFSQMMITTSEIATRYFATPKSASGFNKAFSFHWSDKNNTPVNDWREICKQFLYVPMAHQMVGDYLIIDEAENPEHRRHMIMRPYQVHALRAIEGAAFGKDNEDGYKHGGYVWHTTGSGKTITSFKTALFLSTRVGFDKVVFLVDRRELDKNTSEKFKSYAVYEPVMVDDTRTTYQLDRQFKSDARGIVVTTTFKLNSLVKEYIETNNNSLKNKKYVFIIDEAHRTTLGQMMGTIKDYFRNNSLFFGFTGTPIFDENNVPGMVNQKSEVINTTQKLFGNLLHEYTIDEAIRDGNVLGFHVDYINTGEFESYEQLKAELIERELLEHPEKPKKEVQRAIADLTHAEIEQAAAAKNILVYQDETHIPRVVCEILDNWETQSQRRKFNALLTCAYKERVVAYYHEFKKQLAARGETLNIAMTFSMGGENDPERVATEIVAEMFADYAGFTGIKFIPGDQRNGEDAYFSNLITRFKNGGSKDNPKNVDLIIVADQLLTGYDSRFLNTLYVDRTLQLQGLIQAYSRTNRILDSSKEFGSIINFQFPALTRAAVEKALALYSSGGSSSRAVVETYDLAVLRLATQMAAMQETLPNPTSWQELKGSNAELEFSTAFKAALKQLNSVRQYYEFAWDNERFSLDEHTWLQYVGAYRNLQGPGGDTPDDEIKELISQTMLIDSHPVDLPFILKLIQGKINTEEEVQTVDEESLRLIYEQIEELSNMGDYRQALLLRDFVDTHLIKGLIPSSVSFDDAFAAWKQKQQAEEVGRFAQEWGLDKSLLSKSVQQYSKSKANFVPYSDELLESVVLNPAKQEHYTSPLVYNIQLTRELPLFLAELEEKYSV